MSNYTTTTKSSSSTIYWATATRLCEPRDVGHQCRECKQPFTKVGEILGIRRGGRIELRYHEKCLSHDADPRTQEQSSFRTTKNGATVSNEAPKNMFRKMRTSSHF